MRANSMDESYKHNSEQKQSGVQEDILYNFFFLHKVICMLEIIIAIIFGGSFGC